MGNHFYFASEFTEGAHRDVACRQTVPFAATVRVAFMGPGRSRLSIFGGWEWGLLAWEMVLGAFEGDDAATKAIVQAASKVWNRTKPQPQHRPETIIDARQNVEKWRQDKRRTPSLTLNQFCKNTGLDPRNFRRQRKMIEQRQRDEEADKSGHDFAS